MRDKILISGARAPVALELTRRFSRSGFTAEAADCIPLPLTRFSRLCARYHRFPSPRFETEAFSAFVGKLVDERRYRAIIPTCEETFYFARLKEQRGLSGIFCDSFAKLDRLHNKWRFAQDSRDWLIRAPRSHLLAGPSGLAGLPLPLERYVLKPVYSRFAAHTLVSPRREALAKIPWEKGAWIAQERASGEEICLYAVVVRGRVTAFAAYRPVYRVGLGAGIYLEPEADPRLLAFVQDLAERLDFHGQLAFDLIRGPAGELSLLECNPRSTSGLHFFDDDSALAAAFLGESDQLLRGDLTRPRMVLSAVMIYSVAEELFGGSPARLWRRLSAGRDVIWDARDPLPMLGQYLAFFAFVVQATALGTSAHDVSSRDFEYNGDQE